MWKISGICFFSKSHLSRRVIGLVATVMLYIANTYGAGLLRAWLYCTYARTHSDMCVEEKNETELGCMDNNNNNNNNNIGSSRVIIR